jgi:hypothetical protein
MKTNRILESVSRLVPLHAAQLLRGTMQITKSALIYTLTAFLCFASLSPSWAGGLQSLSPELKEELAYSTGLQAFIYSYPLVHANKFRYTFHSDDSPMYIGPANYLNHYRHLVTAKTATASAPNTDTLYTYAFLDLSDGPIILETPAMGDRYYTIQLADFYATNFGDIGSRHNQGKPGSYLIAGPDWKGETPEGIRQVFRSPTPWVITLLRILADNQDELKALNAMQDGFKLKTTDGKALVSSDPALLPGVPSGNSPMEMWALINRELTSNPPPPSDQALVDQFAVVGIGPGQPQDLSHLDPAVQKGLQRAATQGLQIVTGVARNVTAGSKFVNGWAHGKPNLGRYGSDYLYRAGVTMMGLMANDPIEATYLAVYVDSKGNSFDGKKHYRIHFPAGELPPAKAFWSITLYDSKTFGLVDNTIDRYAVGDRTKGLQYGKDGSLDIYISNEMPDGDRKANWLPAPAKGFWMIMRMYNPEDVVVQQLWTPPAVELMP